jgi:hypothetical protein
MNSTTVYLAFSQLVVDLVDYFWSVTVLLDEYPKSVVEIYQVTVCHEHSHNIYRPLPNHHRESS